MNITRSAAFAAAIFTSTLVLSACEKEGPMERAGKKVDNAAEKVGDKVERAGDKIQDAVKK